MSSAHIWRLKSTPSRFVFSPCVFDWFLDSWMTSQKWNHCQRRCFINGYFINRCFMNRYLMMNSWKYCIELVFFLSFHVPPQTQVIINGDLIVWYKMSLELRWKRNNIFCSNPWDPFLLPPGPGPFKNVGDLPGRPCKTSARLLLQLNVKHGASPSSPTGYLKVMNPI